MRVVALVLVLALVALAPSAHAQGLPTNPVCADITIPNAPPVPEPVAPGGSVEVTLTVQNPSQVPVEVTVAAQATPAQGWQVSTPAPLTIAAGQSGAFVFTVAATDAAVEDATIAFTATGECQPPGGLPCADQCDSGPANSQVLVPLQADGGFTLPGLGSLGVAPELLIAGIVLIGLASVIPFAMRRKKTGLVADCPEPLKMIRAGRGTSFPIEIRNPGKDPATAQFEVGPVPEGWSAFMPLPEVQLAAREARSLWLMVRSPAEARIGEGVDVELRLKDPKRGVNGAVVKVRAEVQAGAEA